jgi:hypothetical protein
MTLQFRLARVEWTTSDETTTTTQIAPPLNVIEYVPAAPSVRVDYTSGRRVGARPVAHDVRNVTETLVLSARCDAPGYLRTLNAAMERAQYWAQGFRRDMRTVLQVRDEGRHAEDVWYEAELYGGRVIFADGGGKTLRLSYEREPYWRGPETVVQVANTSTNWAYADDCDIYNHDDQQPGHNNWVLIDAVDGDVPTPASIKIRNTYDESEGGRLRRVTMGWMDRPALLTLEGEDASGASVSTGAAYSNEANGTGTAFRWTVPNTGLVDYVGLYRVLANGNLSAGDWALSVGYELTRLQTLATVEGERGWTDLGVVSLPPGGYAHPKRYDMRVWLDGDASGSLDFLTFVPMQQYRIVQFRGYNCREGACIEDNGIRDELVYQFGDDRLPILSGWGRQIHLWPEGMLPQALDSETVPNAQMIVFAMEGDGSTARPMRTATVEVRARPRYSILP